MSIGPKIFWKNTQNVHQWMCITSTQVKYLSHKTGFDYESSKTSQIQQKGWRKKSTACFFGIIGHVATVALVQHRTLISGYEHLFVRIDHSSTWQPHIRLKRRNFWPRKTQKYVINDFQHPKKRMFWSYIN